MGKVLKLVLKVFGRETGAQLAEHLAFIEYFIFRHCIGFFFLLLSDLILMKPHEVSTFLIPISYVRKLSPNERK